MNDTLFVYKKRFLIIAFILGYAYIHVKLTGVYSQVTLEKYLNFSAELPFKQRILVSFLGNFFQTIFSLNTEETFFLIELIATVLLYYAVFTLMRVYYKKPVAEFLTWLFFLLLPLFTVLNYRYTNDWPATTFFPYDTLTLFFMFSGLLFCLNKQWPYFLITLFFATLNRESAILLVAIIPALHWYTKPRPWRAFLLACITYSLAKLIVFIIVYKSPGAWALYYQLRSGIPFFAFTMHWVLKDANFLLFVYAFAGLNLFWFTFYDYIPYQFQSLRWICFLYFLGLLLVGNFMETRIFGEIIALLYLPVSLAMQSWLIGDKIKVPALTWYAAINRYFILGFLLLILLFRNPITQFLSTHPF